MVQCIMNWDHTDYGLGNFSRTSFNFFDSASSYIFHDDVRLNLVTKFLVAKYAPIRLNNDEKILVLKSRNK